MQISMNDGRYNESMGFNLKKIACMSCGCLAEISVVLFPFADLCRTSDDAKR